MSARGYLNRSYSQSRIRPEIGPLPLQREDDEVMKSVWTSTQQECNSSQYSEMAYLMPRNRCIRMRLCIVWLSCHMSFSSKGRSTPILIIGVTQVKVVHCQSVHWSSNEGANPFMNRDYYSKDFNMIANKHTSSSSPGLTVLSGMLDVRARPLRVKHISRPTTALPVVSPPRQRKPSRTMIGTTRENRQGIP